MADVNVANILAVDATAEAAFGTAATTPDKAWPFRGGRPNIITEKVNNKDSNIGVYGSGTQTVVVGVRMEAAPEYDMSFDCLAFYLKTILGTLTTTGTGPYVHTITERQGNPDSFTYYWKGPKTTSSKLERFTGVKTARLALSVTAGGKATLTPSLIGSGDHTEQTVSAPSLNTDSILSGAQLSAFTVNGTDYRAKLTQLDLNIERAINPDAQKRMGSTTLLGLDSTDIVVTGSFTLEDAENDLTGIAALAEAATLVPIVITLTLGTASAVITIRKADLTSPGEEGGKGVAMRQVSFEASYSTSDSETMRAVVTNSVSAYT